MLEPLTEAWAPPSRCSCEHGLYRALQSVLRRAVQTMSPQNTRNFFRKTPIQMQ